MRFIGIAEMRFMGSMGCFITSLFLGGVAYVGWPTIDSGVKALFFGIFVVCSAVWAICGVVIWRKGTG